MSIGFLIPQKTHMLVVRAIRSDKCVMGAVLHNGVSGMPAFKCSTFTDFKLLSIFCKVETITNCRPLTKFSTSNEDWRDLIPITLRIGNLHPDFSLKEIYPLYLGCSKLKNLRPSTHTDPVVFQSDKYIMHELRIVKLYICVLQAFYDKTQYHSLIYCQIFVYLCVRKKIVKKRLH